MEKLKNYVNKYAVILLALTMTLAVSCSWGTDSGETIKPEIVEMLPAENAVDVPLNTNVTVVFSEPVVGFSNSETAFTLRRIGSINDVVAIMSYDSEAKTLSLDPDENLEYDSYYIVTLTREIQDRAGNKLSGAPVQWIFTTGEEADLIDPEILSRSPYINQPDALSDTDIVVEFSEAVIGAVAGTTFTLSDSDSNIIPGEITNEDTTVTFSPNSQLTEGEQYTVTLTGGLSAIRDTAGNALTTESWIFKVGDHTPPVILSKYPDTGDTGVPENVILTVSFNERVLNVSNTTITVVGDIDGPVNASISFNTETFVATIQPPEAEPLSTLDTYTVTVRGGASNYIRDYSGNNMAADVTWTFSPDIPADSDPPVIMDRTPGIDAVSVPVDQVIEIEFDEEVLNASQQASFILEEALSGDPVSRTLQYEGYDGDSGNYHVTSSPINSLPENYLKEDTQYKITLKDSITDNTVAKNALTETSWFFTTEDTTPPTVESTSPGIEDDVPRSTHIFVTFSEDVDNVNSTNFYLKDSGGTTVPSSVTYYEDTHSARLTPDTLPLQPPEGDTFTVYLTNGITDSYNPLEEYIWSFTTIDELDETRPAVDTANRSPEGEGPENNGFPLDTNIIVPFTEPVSNVTAQRFKLKDDEDNLVPGLFTFDSETYTITFDPDYALKGSISYYTVEITAGTIQDASGNLMSDTPSDVFSWTFKTEADGTPPTIVFRSPYDIEGTDNVPIDGVEIVVEFSEPMNASSIDDTSFILKDLKTGINEDTTVIYDEDTKRAKLTPANALKQGPDLELYGYSVEFTGDIVDLAGNPLSDPGWDFTTIPDNSGPIIINHTEFPQNGNTGIPRGTDIYVQFNEALDGDTITSGNFTIDPPVAGTYSFNAGDGNKAIFDPTGLLLEDTLYTVTIVEGSGIKDLAENNIAITEDYVWTFRTAAYEDSTPPAVEISTPANGAPNVSLTDPGISAVFTEEVLNVTSTTFYLKQGVTKISADVNYGYASLEDFTSADNVDAVNDTIEIAEPYTTGNVIRLTTSDTLPGGLSTGTNYYVIEDDATHIKLAETLSDAQDSIPIDINDAGAGTHTIYIKTATLEPLYQLEPGVSYTVTLTDGIMDPSANPLSGAPVDWSFTAEGTDNSPPYIVSRWPDPAYTESQNIGTVDTTDEILTVTQACPTETSVRLTTSGTLPDPLLQGVDYYAIHVSDTEIKLAYTEDDAEASNCIDLIDGGSGTHSIIEVVMLKPEITVIFSEKVTGIDKTSFYMSGISSDDFDVYYDDSTFTARLIPRINLSNDTSYTVTLAGTVIEDEDGNDFAGDSWTFTTNARPTILATSGDTSPYDGDTGVSPSGQTTLTIEFSKPMDPDVGNLSFDGGSGHLENRTWLDSYTLQYDIAGPLSENTTYTITFNSWWEPFKDTDGNELDVSTLIDDVLSFTTGADGASPSIVSTIPADGATEVGRDIPAIVIRFSEPMAQQGSLSGAPVGAAVWSEGYTAVSFPVTATLDDTGVGPTTEYEINLTNFQDIAGNALPADVPDFSFYTSSATGSTLITNSSEDFESSSYDPDDEYPAFDYYTNTSGDQRNWSQAYLSKTPNRTPPEGTYMALANTLSWGIGESGYLDQITLSNFSTAGTYLLSFKMAHENFSPASDRLIIQVCTDTEYIQNGPAIYRYNYDFSIVFTDDFETDKGWTFSGGEWERTAPNGYGGDNGNTDPGSAVSGSNVLGYDLTDDGDYSNNISTTYWATSPVIDCSSVTGASLSFMRWLNVERNTYDHAYIEVYDGSSWQQIWQNPSSTITDNSWSEVSFDVSSYADGNPDFQIRFGMGQTDNGWRYSGWNIDNVIINSGWETHYIDLSAYSTEPEVKIRFKAISGGETGGNILIDDVQVNRY